VSRNVSSTNVKDCTFMPKSKVPAFVPSSTNVLIKAENGGRIGA
jgi:hypothetical protein